jgi:small-conductance mechanosensitive channel
MKQDILYSINQAPKLMNAKLGEWLHSLIVLIPNIIVGILLFAFSCIIAYLVAGLVSKKFAKHHRNDLGRLLSSFFKYLIVIAGMVVAITIITPSINFSDLFAGLGIGSVAVGFAFKDILQNWLAGLLILLKQPFRIGDEIKINNFEGIVEKIEARATILKTIQGDNVVLPNSIIYTSAILIKTKNT